MATINVTANSTLAFVQNAPDQRAASASAGNTLTFTGATSNLSPLKLTGSAMLAFDVSADLTRTFLRPAMSYWNVLQSANASVVRHGGISLTAGNTLSFVQSCAKARTCTANSTLSFRVVAKGQAAKTATSTITFTGSATVKRRRLLSATSTIHFQHAFLCFQQ